MRSRLYNDSGFSGVDIWQLNVCLGVTLGMKVESIWCLKDVHIKSKLYKLFCNYGNVTTEGEGEGYRPVVILKLLFFGN